MDYIKRYHSQTYELIKLLSSKEEKKQAVTLLILSVVLALLEAGGVGSILPLVNLIQSPDTMQGTRMWYFLSFLYGTKPAHTIVVMFGITVLAIFFTKSILAGLQLRLFQNFSQSFFRQLSARLMESYMGQPYAFFLANNSTVLAKNITVEAKLVAENFVNPILILISEGLVLISVIIVLFLYRPVISLIGLVAVAVILGSMYMFATKWNRHLGEIRQRTFTQMSKLCNESLAGIKDIKIAGTEHYFINSFESIASHHGHTVALNNTIQQLPRIVLETILVTGFMGFILYITIFNQDNTDLTAVAAMYMAAAYRVMPSVNRMVSSIMSLRYLEAGFNSIVPSLLSAVQSNKIKEQADSKIEFNNSIMVSDGYYHYQDADSYTLTNINLSIDKGEIVGFIGSSGAGKSTLINLLLGLLFFDKESLWIDGIPITEINVRKWQTNVSYVPQSVFMADDTVKNNVALGIKENEINIERLKKALEIAGLSDTIAELPNGINTIIGERGARLSGGQVQRLGIARALYRDTDVLILDEATSALDDETEERIIRSIHKECNKKTVIMIAHRYSSLKYCDRIIRIADGEIADVMTYEKLIQLREGSAQS